MRKIIQNILVVTLALLMLIDIFPIGIRAGDDGPIELGGRDELGKDVETPTTPGYDTTKPGRLYHRGDFNKAAPYLAGEGFYGELSEKTFGQFDLSAKRRKHFDLWSKCLRVKITVVDTTTVYMTHLYIHLIKTHKQPI